MFKSLASQTPLGRAALRVAVGSFIISVMLVIADGIARGEMFRSADRAFFEMLTTWFYDLRIVTDTLMSSALLIFAAAKFLEGRTLLTVGFENVDAGKLTMKPPGDDNVVWVGYRYGTKFEAESVAATLENRLKESRARLEATPQ